MRAVPRSFKDAKEFVASLAKPRKLVFLVTAGPTVAKVIATFAELLEEGDILIDGDGRVTLAYYSKTNTDRPTLEAIIETLKSARHKRR